MHSVCSDLHLVGICTAFVQMVLLRINTGANASAGARRLKRPAPYTHLFLLALLFGAMPHEVYICKAQKVWPTPFSA